eukprot:4901648-Amphidinium_carterae.1
MPIEVSQNPKPEPASLQKYIDADTCGLKSCAMHGDQDTCLMNALSWTRDVEVWIPRQKSYSMASMHGQDTSYSTVWRCGWD